MPCNWRQRPLGQGEMGRKDPEKHFCEIRALKKRGGWGEQPSPLPSPQNCFTHGGSRICPHLWGEACPGVRGCFSVGCSPHCLALLLAGKCVAAV